MLDIDFIRKNPDKVKEGAGRKGVAVDADLILKVDEERRKLIKEVEGLKAKQKKLGKENIGEAQRVKEEIKGIEPELEKKEKDLQSLLLRIPNLPLPEVPVGKDASFNPTVREWGEKPEFGFKPKDYLEIAESLDLVDVKRAAKTSGTRFGFLKNEAVLLEFALIKFTFETLSKAGFVPVIPPIMLKPEMLERSGHLSEKDRPERYYIEKDNVFLAGTAEQPIAAMHADEVLLEDKLPYRYLGFSTCFRREAGSYGKDTKGVFRVHQFDKIEMFSFCHPEKSKEEHQFLLSCQETLTQSLKIPYRVIQICTGDLGFPAASAYDIEAWIPSEKRYRETHTTFNDTDFQTRRLNVRYRDSKSRKLEFTHALNGTAFAVGRTLIAIIENYQQKDGTVKVPKVLQKYVNFKVIK